MHRFGKGHLLNRQVPALRQPKWERLTRAKSFVHTHRKQTTLPERATIEDAARHFLQTRHSVLKPAEKLQLILDTHPACDSQLASQVYQKAREQIRRDTGTLIHRSMTVRIPLASLPMKRKITEHIQRVFMSHEKVPELYRQFLASSIQCVRGQVPKFGDLCKTYRPHISTDQLVHDVLTANKGDVCNCQHMHKCFGLPLVNGHVFTRDFSWVDRYDPCLSAYVFHQNLKNPLLPSWGMVARSTTRELHRTLKAVQGMSTQARLQVIVQVLDMVQCEYTKLLHSTRSMHAVSQVKRSLKRLPPNWILGMFDKGTTELYTCCKYMYLPLLHKGFLQAPKRFTELCRCDTEIHAASEVCAYTVTAAKAFVTGRHFTSVPQYPLPSILVQRGTECIQKAREPLKKTPTHDESGQIFLE